MPNYKKKEFVLQQLKKKQQDDLQTKGGKVWAYVYDSGLEELEEVAMEAYKMYADHNGLDFTVFPSLLTLENEIIGKMASLFSKNPEEIAGSFTSGGTESIMLAVKAARDSAKGNKPHIENPEIILPVTAHAAFHKAAHYLGLIPIVVPVQSDFKVDPKIVKDHISENTIMIVGSSVNYSHGVSDPISKLSEIAIDHDLWFHVDACIGGFIFAYFKELGIDVPDFDFSVAGVSSLSVDLHKYAFAPKGASVLLYRNKELRKHQFYACTNWTGYPVINTTIQSTKSGGPLAACWATLNYIGHDGYKNLIGKIAQTKERMLELFGNIPEIKIMGKPEASLIAFGSDTIDLFQLADEMRKDKWYVQVQPGNEDFEPSIHLTITPISEERTKEFFSDLTKAIERTKEKPRSSTVHQLQALFEDPAELLKPKASMLPILLEAAGVSEDGNLPKNMATINELLHLLPDEITTEAFLYLTNELFTAKINTMGE